MRKKSLFVISNRHLTNWFVTPVMQTYTYDIPKESIDRLHYLNCMSSTCRRLSRREGAATRGTRSSYHTINSISRNKFALGWLLLFSCFFRYYFLEIIWIWIFIISFLRMFKLSNCIQGYIIQNYQRLPKTFFTPFSLLQSWTLVMQIFSWFIRILYQMFIVNKNMWWRMTHNNPMY